MSPYTFNNKNVALKWLQKTLFFQMSFWAQTSLETFYNRECVHPAFPNATALLQCTRVGPFLLGAFYTRFPWGIMFNSSSLSIYAGEGDME